MYSTRKSVLVTTSLFVLFQVAAEDATLHLSLSLLGGAKKRKKKVYTKPKKIPHKHKKVKLAVLKFYKVDGQDRVRRRTCSRTFRVCLRCLGFCVGFV